MVTKRLHRIQSLHCGIYPNWGGGLVVKLAANEGTQLVALQSELVFHLKEHLTRAIGEAQLSDPRVGGEDGFFREARKKQPAMTDRDFDRIDAESTVVGWELQVGSGHVRWRLNFKVGQPRTMELTKEALFLLLDYLEVTTGKGDLVDLREFRKLSIQEMEEEIGALPGYRLAIMFDHFEVSLRLLERNYAELRDHLARYSGRITDAELVLWVRRHHVSLFLEDVVRLLHNFLAACATLIDHSRILYREVYKEESDFSEYQREVDRRFTRDPLAQFVIKLRNFFLHRGIPSITGLTSFEAGGIKGRVYLSKADLQRFSGWNAAATSFLALQEERIDLLEVVDEYYRRVGSFHSWIRARRGRIHYRELREAELKRQALLAKRSGEVVGNVRRRIREQGALSDARLVEIISELLSAEEIHRLRDHENSRPTWLRQAVDLARSRYFLPADFVEELLALGEG